MTKPSETVNVHAVVDDAVASDRRTFIKGVGIAVLTVQCLPLTACNSEAPPSDSKAAADHLIIPSGPGLFHHVHDLLIPYAVLRTPPQDGVALTTTQAIFHRHNIVLTREQLMTVNQGGAVTQKASSHLFVIKLAQRQNHIQAAVAPGQPHG